MAWGKWRSVCALIGAAYFSCCTDQVAAGEGITPENINSALVSLTDNVGFVFQTLKRYYPDDYNGILVKLSADSKNGKSIDQIESDAVDMAINFSRMHRTDEMLAPATNLAAEVTNFKLLIHNLKAEDQNACADFAERGAASPSARMSPDTLRLVGRGEEIRFEAMGTGHKTPTMHGVLSRADMAALKQLMDTREPGTYELMLDISKWRSANTQQKCMVGVSFYDSLSELPKEMQARFRKDSISMIKK